MDSYPAVKTHLHRIPQVRVTREGDDDQLRLDVSDSLEGVSRGRSSSRPVVYEQIISLSSVWMDPAQSTGVGRRCRGQRDDLGHSSLVLLLRPTLALHAQLHPFNV
jgi:hypothetical protein